MQASIGIDKVYTDSQHLFNPIVCKYSNTHKGSSLIGTCSISTFVWGTVIHYQYAALFNSIQLAWCITYGHDLPFRILEPY